MLREAHVSKLFLAIKRTVRAVLSVPYLKMSMPLIPLSDKKCQR